ncbi:MAG: YwiC-like family protein [Chloroflexi bacterium]|nr:YwiC-like family protein [Chloroflexota bacterium]
MSTSATVSSASVRWKSIAFPPEHGSWGFLLEPILLGLILAPSWGGLAVAVGVFGAFLARHPLKVAYSDRRKGKRYARTVVAERFALAYSILAAVGGVLALLLAGPEILLPALLAVPLGLAQFIGYSTNRGRELVPELAGSAALAATATSIAVAGGTAWDTALALWAILVARNIPSILYIRARLRLDRGKPFAQMPVLLAQIAGVLIPIVLVALGVAPVLAVVALAVLAARAIFGLSPYRRNVRVQIIGVLEMVYGFGTVLLALIGYTYNL